ncbi:hypothetical protein [Novispirillum itersonii]|uniref:Ribosomal protein S14 n=1 Tax=Novispirillum itersonii TaxID=189 RepID=A0A7W9ZCN6_NOVIT|nr:hypothetical protein [Novispirillum itersonii]MBB6208798.1 ribosomal protein S14 [Novispirillum itersonii]
MTDPIKDAMSCPACGGGSTVYRRDGATGYRYRRCQVCSHAFVTQELILTGYRVTRYTRRPGFAPADPAGQEHLTKTMKGHPVSAGMALSSTLRP